MAAQQRVGRHIVPVVIGLLGITAAVWLVRSEMRRFRDSTLDSSREIVQEGIDQASDNAEEVIETASSESREIVKDVVKGTGELIDKAAEVPGKIAEDITRGKQETNPTEEPAAEEEKKEPLSASDIISGAFNIAQDAAKTADDIGQELMGLTVDEQNRIGGEVHKLILSEHTTLDSSRQIARLKRLSLPFIKRSSRSGITFTFTVLDSPEINAFAHVGGYIYVNRGLLELVTRDVELEFVMGHEIGHIELKHCQRALTYAARAADLGADVGGEVGRALGDNLVQIAYHLVSVGYSEDREFAADQWAFQRMLERGRSREDALAMSRRFVTLEQERQDPAESDRRQPENVAGTVLRELDKHFKTHPPSTERLRRLQNLQLPATPKVR